MDEQVVLVGFFPLRFLLTLVMHVNPLCVQAFFYNSRRDKWTKYLIRAITHFTIMYPQSTASIEYFLIYEIDRRSNTTPKT
jgi:hypothetical protein